ncbi:MAG: helix-turn-helix transcriptional regulator [Candidatus Bathyarchaeia archaeon]
MGSLEIERLFYELASESRLAILQELREKDGKMNDIARKLDMTTTETFRQLQRLIEASLAKKQPEGTYAITEYGKLVLEFSSPLEFVLQNKDYFLTHDVRCLPHQFIMRIDVLSQASLITGMVESTTKISKMIGQAKYYMWAISPEPLFQSLEDISKEIPEGAEYHVISPQPYMKMANIENRTLIDPPLIMALTETQAAVCFRLLGGKVDYTSFIGDSAAFHEWAKELFLYFWDRGKRV